MSIYGGLGYEYDDGGRRAAGYRGDAGDCVARAIAIVSGRPYRDVYRLLAELNGRRYGKRSARNGIHKADCRAAYRQVGLEQVRLPRTGPRPTYGEAYARYGDCLVTTNGHVAALKDGALRDISDGRFYYWPDPDGNTELRTRKARAVWIPARCPRPEATLTARPGRPREKRTP